MLYAAENVQPPALRSGVLIAKAFERNSYFDFVTALDKTTLRFEEVIWIEIDAPLERIDVAESSARRRRSAGAAGELRAPRSILLDAIRILAKQKRDLPRVVGIDQDLSMLSRLACVARTTLPCISRARIPKWIASGEYQTSTSVGSSAERPSTG